MPHKISREQKAALIKKDPTRMSCMERAMYEAKRHKEIYGPSNREIMVEIKKLQKQIEDLSYQLASHA